MRALELTNQKFGRLSVVSKNVNDRKRVFWNCICDCGNKSVVLGSKLKSGHTVSCGCKQRESILETGKANYKHGATSAQGNHPLYNVRTRMNARCYDKNHEAYDNYGGRGIRVCNAWHFSYESFRDYMLALPKCPTTAKTMGGRMYREIDRFPDNDGNYEPGNVRWATLQEQANNRRTNIVVSIKGNDLTLAMAVRKYGKVQYKVALGRIRSGWPLHRALLEPVRKQG